MWLYGDQKRAFSIYVRVMEYVSHAVTQDQRAARPLPPTLSRRPGGHAACQPHPRAPQPPGTSPQWPAGPQVTFTFEFFTGNCRTNE